MATFTIVVAFLALAASLGSLYLVGDVAKRMEEETRAVVHAQTRPIMKTLEQAGRSILALEQKQAEMAKTLTSLVTQAESADSRLSELNEAMDKTRGLLSALERKAPGRVPDPRGPNRQVQ